MKPNKDFFVECNEGAMMNPSDFENTFCKQCKNRQCVRAGMAFSNWDKRILTQVDRLLNNPNIVIQSETSRWDGISDFEKFSEPQVIEVWGVPESPLQSTQTIREEDDTIPAPPVDPPDVEEDEEEVLPSVENNTYTNPLNTPAREITIGEAPRLIQNSKPKPKNFQTDPWSVSESLPVGGKFKMGK